MPRLIQDGEVPGGGGGGTAIGTISKQIEFVEDWGTGPTEGTKGNFATLDFDPDNDNGIKFDFKVPDDYDSGDLTLNITAAMATSVASPNNQIRVEWEADIIDVSTNSIDTGTYTAAGATVTTREDQNPTRENVGSIAISAIDFQAGDTIQFRLKRDADHGDDDHTGAWQVITLDVSYTGQVAARNHVQHIQLFLDTDETAPASGTKGNFDTMDFSASADNEQKFECMVPEHWDGMSDLHVRLTYALDTGTGGDVVLETEGSIADVSGNDVDTIAVQKFILTVAANTNPYRSVVIRSISVNDIGAGDTLVIKLARRAGTDADDTANSDVFQVINATVVTGVGPSTGFDVISISEGYLFAHDFEVQAGSPTAEQDSPSFAGDFETYMKMTGNGASEQVDVSFQGRLAFAQTTIKQIKIPVKGSSASAQYQIKVYTEGNGNTNQYSASSLTAAPTSRTLVTLTDTDITNHPDVGGSDEGRFFVVVEAHLDASEILYVGRPFVKQE